MQISSAIPLTARLGAYRNLLRRNGGFEVWQRGAGGNAVIAAPAGPTSTYGPDGWYLSTNAGQASTMTQSGPVAVTGSQYSCAVQRNAGQTGVGNIVFGFPLDTDELVVMRGKFVRLSFRIVVGANWSPASGNITAYLACGTGSPTKQVNGFAGQAFPLQQTVVATTSAQAVEINSSVIVPSTTTQAEVLFQWTPVGTAGAADTVYLDDVQLEIVPAATGYVSSDFERLNFQEQLLLCQRDYFKTFKYATAPAAAIGTDTGEILAMAGKAGAAAEFLMPRWPVPMRKVPVLALYSPLSGAAEVLDLSAAANCSSTAPNNTNEVATRITCLGNASTAVGNILGLHVVADAGI